MATNEHGILDTSDDESDLERSHRSYAAMANSLDEDQGIHQSSVVGSHDLNSFEIVDVSSKEIILPEIERVASEAFSQSISGVILGEKFKPSLTPKCSSFISQTDSEGLKQQPTNTTESPLSQPYQLSSTDKKQKEERRKNVEQKVKKGQLKQTKRESSKKIHMQNQYGSLNEIMEKSAFNEVSQAQKVPMQASDEIKNLRFQQKKSIGLHFSRQRSGLSRGVASGGTHISSKKSIELNGLCPNESCSINPISQNSKKYWEDDDEIGLSSRPNLDRFKETVGGSPLNNNSSKKSITRPLWPQQSKEQDPEIMVESHQHSEYRLDPAHRNRKVTPTSGQKQKEGSKLSLQQVESDDQNRKNMEVILTRINQLQSILTNRNLLKEPVISQIQRKSNIHTEQSLLFDQVKQLKSRNQGHSRHNYKSNEINCLSPKDKSRHHEDLKDKIIRKKKDIAQRNMVQLMAQRNIVTLKSREMRQMDYEDETSMDSSQQMTEGYLSDGKYCRNDFSPPKGSQKCSVMKLTFEKVNEIVRRPCFQKKPEQNDAANLLLQKAMRIYQAFDMNVRHFSSIKLSLSKEFVSFESNQEPQQKIIWHFSGRVYVGQMRFTSDYQYYKHGKGIEYEPNQYVYYGQYKQNKMHGSGVANFFNSHTYDGHWCNGIMEGTGIFITVKGDHYQGNFHLGKKQGYGREDYADENIYIGEFLNGMRHGKGVFKWKNGASYRGQFHESMKHGLGAWRSEFGDSYEGSYENDEKHGHGLYWKRDGKCMQCVFKRGKLLHNLQKPTSNTLEQEQQLPPDFPFEQDPFQTNSFKKGQYQRPRKHR